MDKKMQECFKPHVLMHSLFGLGLGIVLVVFVPQLLNLWIGLGLMAVSVVLDFMRKS